MTTIPRTSVLFWGILAGPLAWTAQFTIHYGATTVLCGSAEWQPVLHVATAIALAITATGLVAALRSRRTVEGRGAGPPADRYEQRARSLSHAGIITSGLFLVVIVATGIPALLLDPCRI